MNQYTLVQQLSQGDYESTQIVKNNLNGQKYINRVINMSYCSDTLQVHVLNRVFELQGLSHPNLIKYHYLYFNNTSCNVVQEYANADNLAKVLENKQGLFKEEQILNCFIQLCLGLQYLHNNNIIHGNLTAKNVFISKSQNAHLYQLKIGGFELLKESTTSQQLTTVNKSDNQLHTETIGDIINRCTDDKQRDILSLGIILYQLCTLQSNVLQTTIKMAKDSVKQNKYSENMIELLEKAFQGEKFQQMLLYKLVELTQDMCQTIKLMKKQTINNNWTFNTDAIKDYYQKYKEKSENTLREMVIINIYEEYLKDSHNNYFYYIKYKCYQLIAYLTSILDTQFQYEFQISSKQQVKDFVALFINHEVFTFDQLAVKIKLMQHIEASQLYLPFTTSQMDYLPNELIIGLMHNIENRLQFIHATNSFFIILHRVSDSKIFKVVINKNIQQKMDVLLQQLQQSMSYELYDIIINSNIRYEIVGSLNIRYLNYVYKGKGQITITLEHPEQLITASLEKVKITNINECINLTNIYSYGNTYTQKNIESLRNIKRIYSDSDKYQNPNSCFLEDLFYHNKLEYVNINEDQNMTGKLSLSYNINNLRFISAQDLKIVIQGLSNNIDSLFKVFENKYINHDYKYQAVNFCDQYQIEQYIGKEIIRWYRQLNINDTAFNKLNYVSLFFDIIISQHTSQEKQHLLYTLAQNITKTKQITQKIQINVNDWTQIIKYMKTCTKQDLTKYKIYFISKLYNLWIDQQNDVQMKYNILTVVQSILTLENEIFITLFNINNIYDVKQLAHCLKDDKIESYKQLELASRLSIYLEYKQIEIYFSNTFKLERIPDDTIINMLQNIENRILYVWSEQCFIIIRRILDNTIFKKVISRYTKHQIQQIVQQYCNGDVYDVILLYNDEFESIGKIRMRYLNYINWGNNIIITLNHPQDLVSFSSCNVKITNMSKCINLENISSVSNTYTKQDFEQLHSLKRIIILQCKYINQQSCLLYDLIENNKLEYVYFDNDGADRNIVGSINMYQNISNIRYFHIFQQKAKYNIKLEITFEYPQNMKVYYVETSGNNRNNQFQDTQFGIIEDFKKSDVKNLKSQLLYLVPQNE